MSSLHELVKSVLDDQGCQYEENVVHHLNEYTMKLMKNVISQAKEICDLTRR